MSATAEAMEGHEVMDPNAGTVMIDWQRLIGKNEKSEVAKVFVAERRPGNKVCAVLGWVESVRLLNMPVVYLSKCIRFGGTNARAHTTKMAKIYQMADYTATVVTGGG